jgi:uncharacterized protein with NRDE domain
MCLLVVASRIRDDLPLVVGANRDELLTRPATPMEVLRAESPRAIGGRDLLGGGTWFAANVHGVIAAITNQPRRRDPTKRSRGELPLALTQEVSAVAAVNCFETRFRPSDFNPAWITVADRETLFTIDITGGDQPEVVEIGAGIHVFENCPPGTDSPKIAYVRSRLTDLDALPASTVVPLLTETLADHVPASRYAPPSQRHASAEPANLCAPCVHVNRYGTRWSAVVIVGNSPGPPTLLYANGPPCETEFADATPYWCK